MKSKIIAAMDAAGYHFDELESSDDQLRFAEEVKGTGVTVTAICPGPTATGFEQAASMKKGAVMFRKAADVGSVAAAGSGQWRRERLSVIKASLRRR